MNKLPLIINIGVITTIILQMYKYWILSKGAIYLRRIYWLTIVVGVITFLMNILLVVHDPELWSFLSLQVVIVWSIIMSIKGLMVYNNELKGENV